MRGTKKGNGYAYAVGQDLFARIPKAVWAAIAISSLTCGGDDLANARQHVLREWQALYDNGIVPQPPMKES